MSEFKKYHGIENHYREKFIANMFEYHPEFKDCKYAVSEKIDGANFQISFTIDEGNISVEYGSRNGKLLENSDFYNWQSVVATDKIQKFISNVEEKLSNGELNVERNIVFYGELYGKGIQGRINYGDSKYLAFYDAIIDDKYSTQKEFLTIMELVDALDVCVPYISTDMTFQEAMDIDVETLNSKVPTAEDEALCEGIVIKPYDAVVTNIEGDQILFYIKKKSEKFKDREKVSKRNKSKKEESENLIKARGIFNSYITENRLLDVFGKEGMIQSEKEIGKYVKLVANDAMEDFLKDNSELFEQLTNKERKKVVGGAGKIVAPMCFKHV